MKRVGVLMCLWLAAVAAPAAEKDRGAALIKNRQWKEAEAHYAARLVEFAEAKGPKTEAQLTNLVFAYDVARYFGQMSPDDVASLGDWLLSKRDFTAKLLQAFKPEDSPARAARVLWQLRRRVGEDDVLRYEGLAIAHAVVWDAEKGPSHRFEAADSFEYYIKNGGRMVFDVAQLPCQAAIFLACAEATPAERVWALGKCMEPQQLSQIYHSLEYDWGYVAGAPKKISRFDYTLPNLRKIGGVCVERAYYAANVARAAGIPAVTVYGRGLSGVGHVWTGYIQSLDANQYVWNLGCGRYDAERYYMGSTRDPQTGKGIFDYQAAMRTRECRLPVEKLKASGAWLCLAEVLEKAGKPDLMKGALAQALKSNRFNLAAWGHLTRLCRAGALGTEYADEIIAEAIKTFPDEAEFCFGVYAALLEAVPKEAFAQRSRLYRQGVTFFKFRPDLTVAMARAYGDYLLEADKRDEAYKVYHETIRTYMDDPRLVVDLAIKVTDKQTESDDLDKSVKLLKTLIGRSRKPAYSDPLANHSAWRRLQKCLRGVFEKAGDTEGAQQIEAEFAKFKRK